VHDRIWLIVEGAVVEGENVDDIGADRGVSEIPGVCRAGSAAFQDLVSQVARIYFANSRTRPSSMANEPISGRGTRESASKIRERLRKRLLRGFFL
jgi:hypothetical protein